MYRDNVVCVMYMCGGDRPALRFLPCLLEKAKSYHLLTMVLGVIGPELAPQTLASSDHQEVD